MRRVILLLATFGLAQSGCYSSARCVSGDVTLYWHFPSGSTELSCSQAGVLNVQVSIDGVVQGQFPCLSLSSNGVDTVQGVTITNFLEQQHSFQIDAVNGNGTAIWSDAFSYTPTACTNNRLDRSLTALTGDLTVGYQFTDSFTCTANTFIWYELRDDSNNQVVDFVGRTSADPRAIPCGSIITLPALPFGLYTVTRIEEVLFNSGGNTYSTFHAPCSPQPIDHFQPGETLTVSVPPSNGTCF